MKRELPCDIFGEGFTIRLNIARFTAIESMIKRPIGEVIGLQNALDLTSITAILAAGVRDADGKSKQQRWFMDKIQELLENGHQINEIQELIAKAVVASGLLGTKAYLAVFPEDKTKKLEADAEKETKND